MLHDDYSRNMSWTLNLIYTFYILVWPFPASVFNLFSGDDMAMFYFYTADENNLV